MTLVLSYSYLGGSPLPCGESGGCEVVAASSAARPFGVPLPLAGVGFYLVLLGLTVGALNRESWYRSVGLFWLAAVGAVVSTGLTIYSLTVLRAECGWCLASNVIACALAFVYAFDRRDAFSPPPGRAVWILALAGLVTLGAAGFSMRLVGRPALNMAALAGMSLGELAPDDSIALGVGPGRPTVVIFMDLACPACQESFPTVYRDVVSAHAGLAIRHFPEAIHLGSSALAILAAEAQIEGKGAEFVSDAVREGVSTRAEGLKVFAKLGLSESADLRQSARDRVRRDRLLADRIGVRQVPVILAIRDGRTVPVTVRELSDLLQ